jgi:hypothetical protein
LCRPFIKLAPLAYPCASPLDLYRGIFAYSGCSERDIDDNAGRA